MIQGTTRREKPFYMVYAEGKNSPIYKHESYESAHKEARRLSEFLGVQCYVLIAISSHKCVKYEEQRFDVPCEVLDLPF